MAAPVFAQRLKPPFSGDQAGHAHQLFVLQGEGQAACAPFSPFSISLMLNVMPNILASNRYHQILSLLGLTSR
jgi:hypothetical protein